MSATCRSCGAEIVWARTETTGRPMPIDVEPVDGGNVVLYEAPDTGELTAHVEGKGPHPVTWPTPLRYVSHFTTCPNAAAHRRKASA